MLPRLTAVDNNGYTINPIGVYHATEPVECKFYSKPKMLTATDPNMPSEEQIAQYLAMVLQTATEAADGDLPSNMIKPPVPCTKLGRGDKKDHQLIYIRCKKSNCRFSPCCLQRSNNPIVQECANAIHPNVTAATEAMQMEP